MNAQPNRSLSHIKLPPSKKLKAVFYKKGAILSGLPRSGPGGSPRGIVRSASRRSLLRFAFALENSPAEWKAMVTLTFRDSHPCPKTCLRAWFLTMPFRDTKRYAYAWFMEFQRRHMVHFHVFLSAACLERAFLPFHPEWGHVGRGRKRRLVLRGAIDTCIQRAWVLIVGDSSLEFEAFNAGGITEPLRTSDGAARYAASYAGKAAQKTLPIDQEPLGRWWFLSKAGQPVPEREGFVKAIAAGGARALVFDKRLITLEDDGTPT